MRLIKSHGRLGRQGRALWRKAAGQARLIALPALIALICGYGLSTASDDDRSEQVQFARLEELTTQNRLLSEQIWTHVETVRSLALSFKEIRLARGDAAPAGLILHWAELGVDEAGQFSVRTTSRNPAWKGDEKYYLESVPTRLDLRELRENGASLVRVKQDAMNTQEWWALAFSPAPSSDSVILALVEPKEAFPIFKRLGSKSQGGKFRAYLLGQDGGVLLHSQASYIGSNFGTSKLYLESVRGLFDRTSLGGAGVYPGADRLDVNASYSRLGTLPMALVVERVLPRANGAGISMRSIGRALIILSALMAFLAVYGYWLARREARQQAELSDAENIAENTAQNTEEGESLSEDEPLEAANEIQPEVRKVDDMISRFESGQPLTASMMLGGGRVIENKDLTAAHHALQAVREESALISRFEQEAARLRDPKLVAHRLTQVTAQLCASPTLFFLYQEPLRAAVLHSDSEADNGQPLKSGVSMTFPITDEVLQKLIENDRQEAGPLSLASYPPLARIILNRLGIGHFEAWALTGYGHLGRPSGRPKLLGVLVILQAGTDSANRHDTLSRMMRTTGLVYENTLLSQ